MPVLLVTRTLGTGGVEAIVAALARDLPAHGVQVTVLCEQGGSTAEAMRQAGVEILVAPDLSAAANWLATLPSNSVAQLHNAPRYLVDACISRGFRIVPVVHSTDVNLDQIGWGSEGELADRADAIIAVSDTVREFYESRLPRKPRTRLTVIPNGVDFPMIDTDEIARARTLLQDTLQTDLNGAVVVSCLARYDLQKNIPGLVASFLRAAEIRENLHLVVAGPIEDWLEHAHARAIARTSKAGLRVHLIGKGSSRTLLAASDVFVLDSFFEGWPVAATEAAMAGLPLVLPNVGGAIELVGSGTARGILVDNPAVAPARISLAEIRQARHRVRSQWNGSEFADALLDILADIDSWHARRQELSRQAQASLRSDVMAAAHAEKLRQVAGPLGVPR